MVGANLPQNIFIRLSPVSDDYIPCKLLPFSILGKVADFGAFLNWSVFWKKCFYKNDQNQKFSQYYLKKKRL